MSPWWWSAVAKRARRCSIPSDRLGKASEVAEAISARVSPPSMRFQTKLPRSSSLILGCDMSHLRWSNAPFNPRVAGFGRSTTTRTSPSARQGPSRRGTQLRISSSPGWLTSAIGGSAARPRESRAADRPEGRRRNCCPGSAAGARSRTSPAWPARRAR